MRGWGSQNCKTRKGGGLTVLPLASIILKRVGGVT